MARKKKSTGRRSAEKMLKVSAAAQEHLLDAVHQVWLAGMGAVSRAQRGAPKMLDELVAEGARMNTQARGAAKKIATAVTEMQGAIGGMRGQAADAYESLEKVFQGRVRRALSQLGVPSAETIAALSKRVDTLNDNIAKLIRGGTQRARPRRKVARKVVRKVARKKTRARRAAA